MTKNATEDRMWVWFVEYRAAAGNWSPLWNTVSFQKRVALGHKRTLAASGEWDPRGLRVRRYVREQP